MASLAKDPGGKKRIIFTHPDGKRKTIYLGKCSLAAAQGIKYKVECLVTSKGSGEGLDPSVATWVRDLPNELAKAGLIAERANLDWEQGAITVISPKTEGCGQGTRTIPMFERLRPYLD